MAMQADIRKYADIAEVFEAALVARGGRMQFETEADAIIWRQRAYVYRRMLSRLSRMKEHSEDMEERLTAGLTPYDDFFLQLIEIDGKPCIRIHMERPVTGFFIPKAE